MHVRGLRMHMHADIGNEAATWQKMNMLYWTGFKMRGRDGRSSILMGLNCLCRTRLLAVSVAIVHAELC